MRGFPELPFPVLDALQLGAHRLSVLTDEALFAACGVRVMFTGRAGGESAGPFAHLNCSVDVGDDADAVARNRALVCEATGADPRALITFRQVHGTRLLNVRDEEIARNAAEGEREDADGAVVSVAGAPVMAQSADCPTLAIVAPSGTFAIAHAGWRGTVSHMAGLALDALVAATSEDPATFNAYIGPHICGTCFEVGEEVEARFCGEFGDGVVVSPRHLSLEAALLADLQRAGMDARRIASAGVCTKCCSDRYYSYRATGGACGRQVAFACRIA